MAEITFDSEDIREASARTSQSGIFFDLVTGYHEPADVRGIDTIIPGATGRVARSRVKDVRRVVLEGYVVGTSTANWRTHTDTLMSKLQAVTVKNLVLGDAYLGVSGTKTLACRVVNMVGGPIVAGRFQTWSIELESVTPDWT